MRPVWMAFFAALCIGPARGADFEQAANWRIFRAADGLKDTACSAISMSPRGNLLIKHADADEISIFDGYTFRTAPSPGKNHYRVYESRSGQLWSLSRDGLMVFEGTRWIEHLVPEIQAEIRADPLRQIRQISLIPAERDRVFFLVSDKLMEFNAATGRATLVKSASETGLGRFFEMIEARAGGIWLTGARGLAYVPGPLRRVNSSAPWQEFIVPGTLGAESLQRPFEDDRGAITTLALTTNSPVKRVVLHFDGQTWTHQPVQQEVVRQAWRGWDETTWAFSINSLFRFDPAQPGQVTRQSIWAGQFKDVVTETNGVFWLATSEGLVRYAPFLWRTPEEVHDVRSLLHAMIEDRAKRLWFASTDGLIALQEGRWSRTPWPEAVELTFTVNDGLFTLPDGRLVLGAGDSALLFDPKMGGFKPLTHPEGHKLRVIGQFSDGELCCFTISAEGASEVVKRIERFDGSRFTPWDAASTNASLPEDVAFLFNAQNGDLWFGGVGGLALFRNGEWKPYGPAQGFRELRPNCMIDVGEGRIWCGGADRIYEFNGRKWTTVRTGFDRVNSMIKARDGKLWVASNRGLFTYQNGTWMPQGPDEGLPSVAVSRVLEDSAGRIWAGTTRGLSLFHPGADTSPPKTLPPVVDSSRTASTEGDVTVFFNAVDQWHSTPAERLLFSWRLDDGPWSPFVHSTVKTFERLGSGKHRAEIRAMDRNWNEDNASEVFEFNVVVPWYREPRLIVVSVSGIALALFFAWIAVNRHLQLIRSYAEVEKIVALRTKELARANEELLHSQKMRALGTLAAGIAHDFNNILSIIKGSAQIIERHIEDEQKIRTRVSRIKTVVEQGSGIVKSMLGLSRVTENDFEVCDFQAVLVETAKLLGDRFQNEVTFHVEAEPYLPPVRAARELIQQMLFNFALNAVDALSGGGEVVFRSSTLAELPEGLALHPERAGRYVGVSVQDSGVGIAPEILPRIFEPFFTTKALSSRRGTGLGLSMVYELAKQLGYGLHVESKVGEGSTFTILVPVKVNSASGQTPPSPQFQEEHSSKG